MVSDPPSTRPVLLFIDSLSDVSEVPLVDAPGGGDCDWEEDDLRCSVELEPGSLCNEVAVDDEDEETVPLLVAPCSACDDDDDDC